MSDPELTYYGRVTQEGEIQLPGKKLRREVKVFAGQEIEVTIKRKRRRRSLEQNNYYWGCIVPAFLAAFRDWSPETGWSADMVHEVLKARFLPVIREWVETVNPITGEVIPQPMTTTKLTTTEAEGYYELCRMWAAEMDIIIALPNEQVEMFKPA